MFYKVFLKGFIFGILVVVIIHDFLIRRFNSNNNGDVASFKDIIKNPRVKIWSHWFIPHELWVFKFNLFENILKKCLMNQERKEISAEISCRRDS